MRRLAVYVPGLVFAAAVMALAMAGARGERIWLGRAPVEALVLAILLGAMWRSSGLLPRSAEPGVHLAARRVLEVAVALLGAGFDARPLLHEGPWLSGAIVGVVGLTLAGSYAAGRALALPRRMAALLACGNAICGNSAVAAVAPVIGAGGAEVTAAIGFTSVLGVVTVLGLPALGGVLHLSAVRYGVLTGLTVYAVPQVLAAAAPMGSVAVQTATLVKLARVLLLGPVSAGLAMVMARGREGTRPAAPVLPWFIAAFAGLLVLRSCGVMPGWLAALCGGAAQVLTLLSMAGLGLATDLRSLARSGPAVLAAAAVSSAWLLLLALGVVRLLRV